MLEGKEATTCLARMKMGVLEVSVTVVTRLDADNDWKKVRQSAFACS